MNNKKIGASQLKAFLEKDKDTKQAVTFNWPKYSEIGTPYDVWFKSVDEVEKALEHIVNSQPVPEIPLMYLRREEKDSEGKVIRVHFDIFGKLAMVNETLKMLRIAENIYVTTNTNASAQFTEKMNELTSKLKSQFGEKPTKEQVKEFIDSIKMPQQMKTALIPISDPSKAQEEVEKYLKSIGVDPAKAQVTYENFTKKDEDADLDKAPPLDLSGIDELEMQEENKPSFVMPNPDPDDYN